jgi:hypothetical protein
MSIEKARYVTPHPLPEGLEREFLGILQEECGEVVVHVSKALRFGLEDGYPGSTVTNRECVAEEVGHVIAMARMLVAEGVLSQRAIDAAAAAKPSKVERFLQSVARSEIARSAGGGKKPVADNDIDPDDDTALFAAYGPFGMGAPEEPLQSAPAAEGGEPSAVAKRITDKIWLSSWQAEQLATAIDEALRAATTRIRELEAGDEQRVRDLTKWISILRPILTDPAPRVDDLPATGAENA